MIYLYWYLGIGVAVLAIVFVAHRLRQKVESQFASDLLDAVNPERKTLQHRILNNFVVPVLAAVLVVAVWPIALMMQAKDIFSKKTEIGFPEKREFTVARGDLQEEVTIQEVELRERVVDPLGAVPDLPFGHLNAAWKKFLECVEPDDALWGFSSQWTTWNSRELRSGYVVVRGDTIGPHFLAMREVIDD